MLSFFRRTPQASEAAPPPSKQARERKESAWLQSISSKSTKESSAGTTTLSSSNTPRKGSGTAPHLAHAALKPATASLRPQASSASLKCSATRHSFFRNPLRGREGREGATAQQEEERPGSSYAASAPAQHLHHPPRHHSPPPPLPKPAPPASHTDTSTKSLATRLQELSVANADGLLDDEEYRLLRTRLFETFATGAGGGDQESKSLLVEGREAVPRLGGGSIGASTSTLRPPTTSHTPPTSPQPSSASQHAPSLRSTNTSASRRTSINNLFRRSSATPSVLSNGNGDTTASTPLHEDWNLVPDPAADRSDALSALSSRSARGLGSGATGRSRVLSRVPESPILSVRGTPSIESTPIRTRSVRHHPALASMALSPAGESRYGGGGGSSQGSGGRGGESVRSGGSEGGGARSAYSYSPNKSVRGGSTRGVGGGGGGGSIFPSSATSASSLSHSASASSLLPPIASSTDPFLFASVSKEPTSKELREEIEEIEREWGRMEEMWRGLEGGAIERWEGRVGSEVVRKVKREAVEMAPKEAPAPSGKSKTLKRSSSFSIGLPGRRASTVSTAPSSSPPPPTASSTTTLTSYLLSPTASPSLAHLPEDSQLATEALREEIVEVARRRKTTEEKYVRRLDFLRARLRGAVLKEGIRR